MRLLHCDERERDTQGRLSVLILIGGSFDLCRYLDSEQAKVTQFFNFCNSAPTKKIQQNQKNNSSQFFSFTERSNHQIENRQ